MSRQSDPLACSQCGKVLCEHQEWWTLDAALARKDVLEKRLQRLERDLKALEEQWREWKPTGAGWNGPLQASGYSMAVKDCTKALAALRAKWEVPGE